MKKVLIITYYWPPSGGSGVQRWLKFCKYLRDFGWEPIVYTPENPDIDLVDESLAADVHPNQVVVTLPIREPRRIYNSLMGSSKNGRVTIDDILFLDSSERTSKQGLLVWARCNLLIPDARALWIKPSVNFLAGYLSQQPVDAVVSTGPPHSMHLIARGVSQELGLPWLADLRDPWTGIVYFNKLPLTRWAKAKHRRLEKAVLSSASAVVTVSDQLTNNVRRLGAKKVHTITNGFDDQDMATSQTRTPLDQSFSLTHVGVLTADRVPATLWRAINELSSEVPRFGRDIEVRFVGQVAPSIIDSASRHDAEGIIRQFGYLPHSAAVDQMRKSQILLLIISEKDPGVVTGKIFEYMAAGRPILLIGPPNGDAAAIIEASDTGVVVKPDDLEAMKSILTDWYSRFQNGSLSVSSEDIDRFNRRNLTRRYASLLDEITRGL